MLPAQRFVATEHLLRRLIALAALLAVATFGASARADEPPKQASDSAASLAADAESSRAAGIYDRCIEKDTAAIELEDRASTRVHLAGCAERAGKVIDALEQLRVVLDKALAARDAGLASLVQRRVEQLMKRLGSIVVEVPSESSELEVTVDEVAIDPEKYGKAIALDPGKHRVHAEGLLDGVPSVFDEVETVGDGERVTVHIVLRPRASEFLTPGQLACMQIAKSDSEVMRCLPAKTKPLIARAALEVSGYADSLAVLVFDPAVRASIASPTAGWSLGASYVVDVVSAASPDMVSTASPRGHDTRHAVALNGGYKPGRFGVEATAGYSTEADYISRSGGLAVLADLFDKTVTPRLGWNVGYDTIGRGGTSFDVFSHKLLTNEGTLGTSFVLSPRSVFIAGVSAGFERGDQSKPYRLVPMFARGVQVPAGASADEVNAKRLPVRPYEQLPLERDRLAATLRLVQRLGPSTLRLEERVYADSWQNRASSTDVRLLVDVSPSFTVGPHGRFHAQTGTAFFQRVYHADTEPVVTVPVFRTTDRELGPLWSVTGGASAWWKLSPEGDGVGWTLYASGDALYSQYKDSIYVSSRLAGYGTIGIEAVFE
jgi:hypothetical protein